jgi:hypothetical protein
MPSNTGRVGRAAIWLSIVLGLAGAVLAAVAGTWSSVVVGLGIVSLGVLLLGMRQTRARR